MYQIVRISDRRLNPDDLCESRLLEDPGQDLHVVIVGVGHLHCTKASLVSSPVPGNGPGVKKEDEIRTDLATRSSSSWNMKLRLAQSFIIVLRKSHHSLIHSYSLYTKYIAFYKLTACGHRITYYYQG